jgi:hypothetical protein
VKKVYISQQLQTAGFFMFIDDIFHNPMRCGRVFGKLSGAFYDHFMFIIGLL